MLIRAPSDAFGHILSLAVCVALYALVAHGVQTFRALHVVAGSVLAMVLVVCGVGAHQGFAPTGCIVVDETSRGDNASGKPDGRPCDNVRSCYLGDAEPGAEYLCEHVGLFGTTSVGRGRVRYRGVLQDPNELALAGGVGLPLAFAIGSVPRRSLGKGALVFLTLVLVVLCAVLTGSRSGQLVFLAVLGVLFFPALRLEGRARGGHGGAAAARARWPKRRGSGELDQRANRLLDGGVVDVESESVDSAWASASSVSTTTSPRTTRTCWRSQSSARSACCSFRSSFTFRSRSRSGSCVR